MSKIKAKLKKKPTFESAEAKPLTKKESQKLSRSMILEWFKNHRWGKLKALQLEITEKTEDEKLDLRELIIANTKKNLEKQKRAAQKEKMTDVTKFADQITGISDEKDSIMKVLKHHQHKRREEDLFFKTLDNYVGKQKESKRLKKLIKNNVYAAQLMVLIRANNPKAMDDINLAINQGDYEKLKKAMVNADSSITKERVDYVFAAALTQSTGMKEYTGNKTVDGLLNHVAKLRYIGHTYAMKKAAKAAKVSFWLVMRLGQETLHDLRTMDDRLQSHLALIQHKGKLTKKDRERILFIDEVHKMRTTYDAKVDEKGLEDTFMKQLDKHVDEKFKTEKFKKRVGSNVDLVRLKAEIMDNAKLVDLKLYQIFDLTYGSEEERSRLFSHSLIRGAAIGRQFYKTLRLDEDAKLKKALSAYWGRRMSNSAIWKFRANVDNWGMKALQKEMRALEKNAKALSDSKTSGLLKDADAFKLDAGSKHITSQEIYSRDMIIKKYHILSHRASQLMTKKAQPIVEASKVIGRARSSVRDFNNTLVKDMNISDDTLKKIYNGKVPAKANLRGRDILKQFGKKAVELKTMQEVTRARFAGLAEHLEKNVEVPFNKKMTGQLADISQAKFRNNVNKKLDNIATTSRVRKYGVKFALPAIILAIHANRLWTGQAKTGEVIWDLTEAGLGFVPVIGTTLDFKAMWSGKSLSGKQLSKKERVMSGIFFVVGAVADFLTVVGGVGLGLRATIGGMKGTRRALQAGKTMGNLADAGHIAKAGPLNRVGGWFSGTFNEAQRLEGAVRASGEAKALDQANMIKDLQFRIGRKIDPKNLEAELAAIKGDPSLMKKPHVAKHVGRIEDLNRGLGSGRDYMKIFGEGVQVPTHKLSGMLSGSWMRVKSTWLKMKKTLLSIGVSKGAIGDYEKSFDAVRKLENAKVGHIKDIKDLAGKRVLAEKHLESLKALKAQAGSSEKSFMKAIEKQKALMKKKRKLKRDKAELLKYKKKLEAEKRAFEAAKKNKLSDDEFLKLNSKLETKISKVDYEKFHKSGKIKRTREIKRDLQAVNPNLAKIEKFQTSVTTKISDQGNVIKNMEDNLAKTNKDWLKGYKESSKVVDQTEGKIAIAEKQLKKTNTALQNASAERFRIRTRIEMKAETWMSRSDNMRRFAKVVQWAGMGSGLIYFLSDYKYGATKQYATVKKGVGAVTGAAGFVSHQLYSANHGGKDSINQYIEKKIHALEQKNKMAGIIDQAKKDGRSELDTLAANINTRGAQEYIKSNGLAGKMAALRAKISGASRREIVTGDAAKKAGEKLRG